ncbi:Nucleotide-binding universal stress protein, UspA family [Actinopolyspora mzabensis]|uniref:Nucleotide-binding universal stress protein, UspA family n=1 Tax=Actinopolyspora mzabensis TaxID=995066 RepID=A0A1G8XX97_ACTMZ|nr:universal stress protein [Actinopolyspora mzabensis]SDJ95229.1 Nucleotide-binding universal stress protein, UspA family [Actinopolyspora mzabensis]
MSTEQERVVVGVDGSSGAAEALSWALRYASNSGAEVTALIAWTHPSYYGLGAPIPEEDIDQRAEQRLSQAVADAVSQLGVDVGIRQRVVRGIPAGALLDAAEDADLLVVGSRGHGGFTGALLGSVSQHCVHHAPCPVVVVRERSE